MRLPHILIAGALLLTACWRAEPEQQIQNELQKANYCDTASDCVNVGGKCPFDCYSFVNKKEAERMISRIMKFESACVYKCAAMKSVSCVNNSCTVILEGEEEPSAKKTVGETCEQHSDCETPMSYLTRSSCQFASRCIEGTWSVVCPMSDDGSTGSSGTGKVGSDCSCPGVAARGKKCSCIDGACMAVME